MWGGQIDRAELSMNQLAERGDELYTWLLETDLAIKGTHSEDSRARWAFEKLLLRMSSDLATSAKIAR